MGSSPPAFQYSPIDTRRQDSFRLLDVLPGAFPDPIKCVLKQDFRGVPGRVYEALSYTWGDRKPDRTISLNGLRFSVTENLEHALRNLRDDSIVRTIWVDAICIDQSQVPERSHQVAQMQQIYAGAKRVVIWLGPSDQDGDTAMSFVARLCERVRLVDNLLYHQCTDALKDMQLKAWEIGRLERLWAHLSQEGWLLVARLLQRPWWRRVWVVQEVASARDAVLCCGEYSIPWEYMALVVRFIGVSNMLGTTVSQESLDRAWSIVATSQRFAFYGWSDLVNLLHRSRQLFCQDPKDKVIALLGLAEFRNQVCFGADYSKSLAWVYTMAFISSIRSRGDLEILTLVDHLTIDLRFPSWVADLDRKTTTWRFNKFRRDYTPYRCPKDSLPTFSEDLNIIYADGFCIDVLVEDNVQQTDEPFQSASSLKIGYNWSWNMDAMATRLISGSALRNQYDCGSSTMRNSAEESKDHSTM